MRHLELFGVEGWKWLAMIGAIVLGSLVAHLLGRGALRLIRRAVGRRRWAADAVAQLETPIRGLFLVLFARLVLHALALPRDWQPTIRTSVTVLCIALLGWLLLRVLRAVVAAVIDGSSPRDSADPDRIARGRVVRTQAILAQRLVSFVILGIGIALIALQFDVVRSLGVSLLASAGLAGVVLGLAAQRSLEALLAGLQISVTQPIRIGDSIELEGEMGTVDDVRLRHVIVRLWDQRRMIVPTTKLLEQPFQNLSRSANGLLGTVFLWVDYGAPIDAIRAEVDRILTKDSGWDGGTKVVHVTDANERFVEVRVLLSASDAGRLWDVRSYVREHLVEWLARHQDGRWLPRALREPMLPLLEPAPVEAKPPLRITRGRGS